MSESEKKGPSHRVSFAAFERDSNGGRKLGNAREIGAIWERKERDGEGILRFDHTPREDGVYFVRDLSVEQETPDDAPKDVPKNERTSSRKRDTDRER